MNRKLLALAALSLGLTSQSPVSHAQTCEFIGQRVIKGLWLENGFGLTITPDQAFDNNRGCTMNTTAVVHADHPQFKNLHAMALLALATGRPINAYGCGCISGWGNTYPAILSFGVQPTP